ALVLLHASSSLRYLSSFPTRRSSDLPVRPRAHHGAVRRRRREGRARGGRSLRRRARARLGGAPGCPVRPRARRRVRPRGVGRREHGVRGLLVTGTDTGVGKTVVSAALLAAMAAAGEARSEERRVGKAGSRRG